MLLVTTFFVTLMNCDLNVYNHIPYKSLQDCDYRQKTKKTKTKTKKLYKIDLLW
jgi:hypothetical protein